MSIVRIEKKLRESRSVHYTGIRLWNAQKHSKHLTKEKSKYTLFCLKSRINITDTQCVVA